LESTRKKGDVALTFHPVQERRGSSTVAFFETIEPYKKDALPEFDFFRRLPQSMNVAQ
jgi:hypothetical protein